jgi:hypothetical protein
MVALLQNHIIQYILEFITDKDFLSSYNNPEHLGYQQKVKKTNLCRVQGVYS